MNENNNQVMTPTQSVKNLLGSTNIKQKFENMLGKRAAAFLSSIQTAVSQNPTLGQCDPMSVISAAAIAASMDLPINPGLGFAHIVPYKTRERGWQAQFQIGWKGFVQLAMRSGQYRTINIAKVFDGQIKDHNPFTGEMEFNREATSKKIIGYLLYFKLLNGFEKYHYMTAEEAEAHGKEYSQSYKKGFGMWRDDFDAMALKTVAKLGLSKYGILSVDMQQAIEFDQSTTENDIPKYIDNDPGEAKSAEVESIIEKINSAAEPVQENSHPPDPESFDGFQGGPLKTT